MRAAPADENIQAWLAHLQADEHELAWRALVADNPFAAIHGRVCYHPCESVCNRADLDTAVSIHSVERYLGDLALERGWRFDPPWVTSSKRVLVIGAGPSGLSAAYHLARLGHEVEVRDAGSEPGGMMRYGLPAYRMPRDVLSGEIERIAALGVRFTNKHLVFVAVGAHLSKRVEIPAMDAGPILDAVSFPRGVASGERPEIGRRIAIYGGGNTAMDAARTARRLGAEETLIVYRRTREQMPAHEEESRDAEREFGQMSKATPLGAVAKFASAGKTMPTKDLALQAISYANAYVARVAMRTDPQQTLTAFREAKACDGPRCRSLTATASGRGSTCDPGSTSGTGRWRAATGR